MQVDSSDEEDGHPPSRYTPAAPVPLPMQSLSISVATQTPGTLLDHVLEYAARSSLAVINLKEISNQFWESILSCMKMPAGGVNGGGSMHYSTEFVAASETVVQHLMEDLPLRQNFRYNASRVTAQDASPWEASPTISTYYALESRLIDSFFRLHRRRVTQGRTYRGSKLATPPDGYEASVCTLSVCPPFLVELCHRKHNKLVLAVSFNVAVYNDLALLTLPPSIRFVVGQDMFQESRIKNHLKKMLAKNQKMSTAFQLLATQWPLGGELSDGEWVPPARDLSLLGLPPRGVLGPGWDSGDEADTEVEEEAEVARASAASKRPRGVGTRWNGRMRQH